MRFKYNACASVPVSSYEWDYKLHSYDMLAVCKHKIALLKQGILLKGLEVYLNEHLTKRNADIAKKARLLKKQKKIQSTWTTNCKVFIKLYATAEEARVLYIRDIEELDKLQWASNGLQGNAQAWQQYPQLWTTLTDIHLQWTVHMKTKNRQLLNTLNIILKTQQVILILAITFLAMLIIIVFKYTYEQYNKTFIINNNNN